jgi:DNA-binding PadR family transcriptional regulator
MPAYLGEFEQLVMLAILRLEGEATGAAIRAMVEENSGRTVWIGAVHTTLDRLEAKALVTSDRMADGSSGRPRKTFALTRDGQAALARAYATFSRMTRGLKPKLDPH